MNTVAGLTGIGLVTFVLFASSVSVRVDSRIEQRRLAARQDAAAYGLDPKALEADPVYNRYLYSRVGPRHYLAELKKKAADVAKRD